MTKKHSDECPFDYRLYRTPYLVLPKLAIQSMPLEWRERLEALLVEADATGLETPEYHVLRQEPEYTTVRPYDSEDETSRDFEFTAWREDPWSNYRRGNAQELSPNFVPA